MEKGDFTINTKQGLEVMRIINKLGVKEDILSAINDMSKIKIKQQGVYQKITGNIEKELGPQEFEKVREEEKIGIYIIKEYEKHPELKERMDNFENEGQKIMLNIIYTVLIERMGEIEKDLYKLLGEVYNLKPKDIEVQDFDKTIEQVYKIVTCNTMQKLFTLAS